MRLKLKNKYYMKQLFNNLFLFIIILNASCGKQAFFSTARYPNRPPAPMAPPIPSGSSFTNNTQAYSLNIIPYFSIGRYVGDMPLAVANIEPLDMTYTTSYIETNTSHFRGLRPSSTTLYSPADNTQPLDMTHTTSYIDTNASRFRGLRPSSTALYSPAVNTQPLDMTHTTSYIDTNASRFRGLRPSSTVLYSPVVNTQPLDMTHTTSYIDTNASRFRGLRSSSTALYSPAVNIQPLDMTHTTSYIDTNASRFRGLRPSSTALYSPAVNIQPLDMTHTFVNTNTSFDQNVIINNEDRGEFINIRPKIKTFFTIGQAPPPKIIERISQHEFHDSFSYTLSEKIFSQLIYDRNRTTMFFQAFDAHLNIRDLQKNDIILSENGIEIENYTLSSTRRRLNHDLEVVFVVDVGASMEIYGENVKENIIYFVDRLQTAQIGTKFCLLEFTDLVREGQCNMFFPDNPITPDDENTMKFLNDVSKLTFEEKSAFNKQNALRGLLEASSKTPWSANSQRMVILITDAMFWVAVESEVERDARTAPDYEDVLTSLDQKKIQVFSLTQDFNGFSRNYSGHPSITEGKDARLAGQWFQIKNLNNQDMDSIFNQVEEQVDISYKIEYFVEDQEGLNASLPLDDREIILTAYNPEEVNIRTRGVYSNMPEGSSQLQSYWPLDEISVNENHTFVTIDGQSEYNFYIENGEIVFSNPPPSGSEIFVQYEVGSLRDNIDEHTLLLPDDPKHQGSSNVKIDSVSLMLNDIGVSDQDFEIVFSDLENIQLRLNKDVFDNADPYNIRNSGELKISLWYEIVSQHNSVN